MALFVALLVLAAIVGSLYGVRHLFDGLLDVREHGTPQQELRRSEQLTGAVIQSGSGGFNGR